MMFSLADADKTEMILVPLLDPKRLVAASVPIRYKSPSLKNKITSNKYGIKRIKRSANAKYVMASPELFGDTKEHTIDLNILGIEDEVKKTFFIEFSISVDGVEQTVYYPEYWEGLYPKDPHGNAHSPYFVLNVDAL